MSKLHITLAENMSRFGTKNLTEANKRSLQYLAEQGNVPGKKPVSTTTPVQKPAVDTNTSVTNYTPYVDAAQAAAGTGYKVVTPLTSTGEMSLQDSRLLRTPASFRQEFQNKIYATYGALSTININLKTGQLTHDYQYQYGQAGSKPLTFFTDKTGNTIGFQYIWTKTYTFKPGDLVDFNKQLNTLKPVLAYIFASGPVATYSGGSDGPITHTVFSKQMTTFTYKLEKTQSGN